MLHGVVLARMQRENCTSLNVLGLLLLLLKGPRVLKPPKDEERRPKLSARRSLSWWQKKTTCQSLKYSSTYVFCYVGEYYLSTAVVRYNLIASCLPPVSPVRGEELVVIPEPAPCPLPEMFSSEGLAEGLPPLRRRWWRRGKDRPG